jgi:hypothetical protein
MGEDEGRRRGAKRTTAQLESGVEGLAAHERGIDAGEEGSHGIILWHKEEIDGTAWASDVSVKAHADAEDNAAHGPIVNDR